MMIFNQAVMVAPGQKDGMTALMNLERCGRISHMSEPTGTPEAAEAFVKKLIGWGHESVLEHESLTMRIITDRGVSHELVRHRIGTAFTQESTRYVDYSEDLQVVSPPFEAPAQYRAWHDHMQRVEAAYKSLREAGVPPEVARSVLPTCAKTELYMTANIREWRHIIRLRSHKAAHPQMRKLAFKMYQVLRHWLPVIVCDFEIEEV